MHLNIKINKIRPTIKTKRSILVVVIFFFLLSPVVFLKPQKAFALGIFVPTNDMQLNVTTSANLGTNTWKVSRQEIFDTMAYSAATVVIQKISTNLQNSILKQANSFVKDLRADLIKVENKVGKKLGVQISAVEGCFPNLDLSPVPKPVWTPYKFGLSITCTPKQNSKFQAFFKSGGFTWDAFKKMTSDPARYNPFGGVIAVNLEFSKRKRQAKQKEIEQLKWGRGLRGVKDAITGLIKTPAAEVQGMADWAFSSRLDRVKNTTGIGAIIAQTTSALVSNALKGTFVDPK